ncbi:MAG TPA: DUF3343 domain-containing protein [Clostridiales bacterium]|nr:DUF3343 domain-containing protein [Clostridiales bacterium]
MYYLVLVDSGNYAIRLSRIMAQKGYPVEVVSTPCKIAKNGCGYCLRLIPEYKDTLINEGKTNAINIREIYSVTNASYKNIYKKIYP